MKNLIKIIFVLSFLMPVCVQGQAVTWQRIFSYNNELSVGRDILQTYDGGYIICGLVASPVRIYLIKLDYLGNKLWEKIISDSTGAYLDALSIKQTSDSGYVMTGRNQLDLCVLKTDKNGNQLWKKRFNRGGETFGRSIKIANDKGFIACGDSYSTHNEKAYVVKLDSSGNLEWDYLVGENLDVVFGSDIIQLPNDSYFLVGLSRLNINPPTNYTFVIKLNSLGVETWRYVYQQWNNNWGQKITNLQSGNIVICGFGYPYGIFFSKIDTFGNILKVNVIPTSSPQLYFRSMCINSSNQLIVAAKERYPIQIGSGYFSGAIIDTSGNLIMEKRLMSPENVENNPYSIKATSDNGYVFVGDTEYGFGKIENILVAKTDSLFNTSKIIGIHAENFILNEDFILYQNYPNPFNPVTTINFSIPKQGNVTLKVYDITGKEVKTLINEQRAAGNYTVTFSATVGGFNLPSGAYIYRLESGEFSEIKMLILLK